MPKSFSYVCCFLLIILSFSKSYSQGSFTIQVEIDPVQDLDGKYAYINYVDYSDLNNLKEDSVLIEGNKFEFTGKLITPGVLTNLYMKEPNYKGMHQFLLTPGINNLFVHKPLFNQVTGNLIKGLSNVENLENKEALIYHRYNSTYQIILQENIWTMNRNGNANEVFSRLKKEILPLRIEIVQMYPNSYASLFIQRYFLFTELEDKPDLTKELYNGLSDSIRQFPEAQELALKINAQLSMKKGEKVEDFTIKDVDDKIIRLSDFRGKKVLLEFWASWCVPCIQNLPKLKEFSKENPEIVILAISLDDNKENWKDAITKHKFNFAKHVSELKGWKGLVSNTVFNIDAIPRAILINEKGNIENEDFKIETK